MNQTEFARICGVSRQVVSCILNGKPPDKIRFSEKTRRMVLEKVEKSGYRINRTAQSFKSNKHRVFGIFLHDISNVPGDLLRFLIYEASKIDYQITLESTWHIPGRVPIMLREDCADGLIIFEDINEDYSKKIKKTSMPCVFVNCNPVGAANGISILFDERQGIFDAAEHLAARGKSRLALLSFFSAHYSCAIRRKALSDFCELRKLPPPIIADIAKDCYDLHLIEFVKNNPSVDGIIISSDEFAPSIYEAADLCGRKIPRDLGVVGFNFSYDTPSMYPKLTNLFIDRGELAKLIISNSIESVEHPALAPKTISPIRYSLVQEQSS